MAGLLTLRARGHTFSWNPERPRTLVMGIVNVTPDSFSDGGRFLDPAAAHAHALRLRAEGADLVDVGAESTRPGSAGVASEEEIRRLAPVLERLLRDPPCPVSVDTTKPEVAEMALHLGAHLINDVTALGASAELARVVARHRAGLVLVHMRGAPATMQEAPAYEDVVAEVRAELGAALARAEVAGVPREAICLDPGIGFGKTVEHNLALLRHLEAFHTLGRPLLVGPSRKRFIGELLDAPPAERVEGTIAACLAAVAGGAAIVRVHDVAAVRRALVVAEAIRGAGASRASA